jgi:hypothetical protein
MRSFQSHANREVQMGSFKHPRVFHPLDLEVIDLVYEAAWAKIEALDPFRDRERDEDLAKVLRKLVMDQTRTGTERIEFDTLYDKVLANLDKVLADTPETWFMFTSPHSFKHTPPR